MRHCDSIAHIQVPNEYFMDQIKMIETCNELKVLLNIPYEVKTPQGIKFTQLELAYEEKDYTK